MNKPANKGRKAVSRAARELARRRAGSLSAEERTAIASKAGQTWAARLAALKAVAKAAIRWRDARAASDAVEPDEALYLAEGECEVAFWRAVDAWEAMGGKTE